MSGMGVTLDYARGEAPLDVADVLGWLAGEGFAVVSEQGGPGESSGDLLVEFGRRGLVVRITRDRGQWMADLAAGGGRFVPLHILLTAWEGSTPSPADHELGGRLPEVIPQGVQWRVVLPGVISWLESGNRSREIGEARAAWAVAMKRRLDSKRRQS